MSNINSKFRTKLKPWSSMIGQVRTFPKCKDGLEHLVNFHMLFANGAWWVRVQKGTHLYNKMGILVNVSHGVIEKS
jgi:hypothetical protein